METEDKDKIALTVQIPKELHQRAKKYCRKNKITMYTFIEELIRYKLILAAVEKKERREYLKENS